MELAVYCSGGTRVKDLSPLKNLRRLHHLDLYDSDVEDLTSLPPVPYLNFLVVGGPRFASLAGLEECFPADKDTQLGQRPVCELEIRECSVKDLSPIEAIPNLTSLVLDSLPVTQLPRLNSDLRRLEVRNVDISDFSGLMSCALNTLIIESPGEDFDIEILQAIDRGSVSHQTRKSNWDSDAPSLTTLELVGVTIGDLKSLFRFKNLRKLKIAECECRGFEHLAELEDLNDIFLSCKGLKDIGWTTELNELSSLRIPNSQVTDISPLVQLTDLYYLDLSGCTVNNWEPLTKMDNLISLVLSRSNIDDLEFVASLPRLNFLNISDTRVTDVSPLVQSKTPVNSLDLMGLTLSDPSSVGQLNWLTWLNISSSKDFDPSYFAPDSFSGELLVANIDVDFDRLRKQLPNCEIVVELPEGNDASFFDRHPVSCF